MRRLLPVVVIAGLVFMAGCGSNSGVPDNDINWLKYADRDVGCRGTHVLVNQIRYDMNGGKADAFVTLACQRKGQSKPGPSLLEVFDGDRSVTAQPIAVLVYLEDGLIVNNVCFDKRIVFYSVSSNGATWMKAARWQKGHRFVEAAVGERHC
jgi:hypothetical protein